MNILSLQYLLFSAETALFTWLFPNRTRTVTVLIINVLFLFLLRSDVISVGYVVALSVWIYGFGWILDGPYRSRAMLGIGLAVPVVGLLFFKYAGYFGQTVLMPLGISFYTFKGLGYLIDVWQKKTVHRNLIKVFDYVTFFPVFMAGPIHRASSFFEQLETPWTFEYTDQKNGFVQAMLGVVEKMVIADQLSAMVKVFLNSALSGWYTIFGVILYAFQIYADFDAYSNIAIGIARMLGFHLKKNFHSPYLSASIAEFWRRWHISLSSWLRDYIYIPLGGNRTGELRRNLNILIVFVISGLWHGSTRMFLFWGLGHALIHILEGLFAKHLKKTAVPAPLRLLGVLVNFIIVALLWILFRSASMAEALGIFERMTQIRGGLSISAEAAGITVNELGWTLILLLIIIISDLLRSRYDMLDMLAKRFIVTRWVFYAAVVVLTIIFGVYGPGYHPEDFIYVTF